MHHLFKDSNRGCLRCRNVLNEGTYIKLHIHFVAAECLSNRDLAFESLLGDHLVKTLLLCQSARELRVHTSSFVSVFRK